MNEENSPNRFQVDQIDHVELYVPNRKSAAGWFHDVLGLHVISEFAHWADDSRGPLMIGTKFGNTKLALFEGEPAGSQPRIGFHLVAFRVSASSFAQFVAMLPELNLSNEQGRVVDREMVADHGKAFSVYFCDPYGHQFELTTYDYEDAKTELKQIVNR